MCRFGRATLEQQWQHNQQQGHERRETQLAPQEVWIALAHLRRFVEIFQTFSRLIPTGEVEEVRLIVRSRRNATREFINELLLVIELDKPLDDVVVAGSQRQV